MRPTDSRAAWFLEDEESAVNILDQNILMATPSVFEDISYLQDEGDALHCPGKTSSNTYHSSTNKNSRRYTLTETLRTSALTTLVGIASVCSCLRPCSLPLQPMLP